MSNQWWWLVWYISGPAKLLFDGASLFCLPCRWWEGKKKGEGTKPDHSRGRFEATPQCCLCSGVMKKLFQEIRSIQTFNVDDGGPELLHTNTVESANTEDFGQPPNCAAFVCFCFQKKKDFSELETLMTNDESMSMGSNWKVNHTKTKCSSQHFIFLLLFYNFDLETLSTLIICAIYCTSELNGELQTKPQSIL